MLLDLNTCFVLCGLLNFDAQSNLMKRTHQPGFKECFFLEFSGQLSVYKWPLALMLVCSLFTESKNKERWLVWLSDYYKSDPFEHSVTRLIAQITCFFRRWWRYPLEERCGWSPEWVAVSGQTVWRLGKKRLELF